jgi:hypothetical protein
LIRVGARPPLTSGSAQRSRCVQAPGSDPGIGAVLSHTFESVLADLRAEATSARDLVDRFERLMRSHLTIDPLFAQRFDEVWLWQQWPGRDGQADTGIDLVATEHGGGVCAIQSTAIPVGSVGLRP